MRIRRNGKSIAVSVIACDLDRTLTDARLRAVPAALDALREARRRGALTILVTGRTWAELRRRPALLRVFDACVAESGAVISTPRGAIRRDGADLWRFADWLKQRSIEHRRGLAAVSFSRGDLAAARRYPKFGRLAAHTNRDRVDVTTRGVDKGTGLQTAIRNLPKRRAGVIVAFGDAANDVTLFRAAQYRVAVANAEPGLKRAADEVTHDPGGRGVADFIRSRMLAED